jgi:hypothetical protein
MRGTFAALWGSPTVSGGILGGYTIVERPNGKSLSHHEYEFKSKEDLARFFTPHFKHVTVFETIYPERHNLYFWASLPDTFLSYFEISS